MLKPISSDGGQAPQSAPAIPARLLRFASVAALNTALICVAVTCGFVSPALVQAQSLESLRDIEALLLEQRLDDYGDADRRARTAESQYRELRQQLSGVLGDSEVQLKQLRALEAQTSLAREKAYLRDREATDLRHEIYSYLERIGAMDSAIAALGPRLSGTWSIDFGDDFGAGTVTFRMSGDRANGTYRLTNGALGQIRGELIGRNIDLVRYGPGGNSQLQVRGRLSVNGQTMNGDWVATELGGGRNTIGKWTAQRAP